MDEIYHQALKLLRRRDYTVRQLKEKLSRKFGDVPEETIDGLRKKRFLDDERFAANLVSKRRDCHPSRIREELLIAGISPEIAAHALTGFDGPSLRDAVRAKMNDWKLQAPIPHREAARLYRTLARLGYPEDEIREELEHFHEQ